MKSTIFDKYFKNFSLDNTFRDWSARNMLTDGAAATYPLTSFEFSDRNGIMFGVNEHNKSIVMVNPFDSVRHSNANMVMLGMSGAGKTFLLQLLAGRFRMLGIPVMIIAPLKGWEFKNLCAAIGGEYFKISPSSPFTINIMDIRTQGAKLHPDKSLLMDKLSSLHTFFSLMFRENKPGGMTVIEKQYLDEKLMEVYRRHDITPDNESLLKQKRTMPVLGDLYTLLEADKQTSRLAILLKPYVSGSLQIFNGQTNVNLSNPYIVADISELTDETISLGMLLVLDIFWDRIKEDIFAKKLLCIDELWRLIGAGGNRRTAEFVVEIWKTIRGMGGGAVGASQDIEDFFGLENGQYGKTIVSNSRLKILMQMEDNPAKIVSGVFGLSEEETAKLTTFPRGHGLFYSGSNHVAINFLASPTEHDFITMDRKDMEHLQKEGRIAS